MRRDWLLGAALALLVTPAAADHSYTSSAVKFATMAAEGQPTIELPATLLKPDGAGPFPAVVVLHDCSGLGARSSGAPGRWADLLAREGYVVAIPDSFTPRGLPDGICTAGISREQRVSVGFGARARDAYAALAFLRSIDYVDGRHVGVMGGSHGGMATLAVMSAGGPTPQIAAAKRDGFAAGIALYPECGNRYGSWTPQRKFGERGPVTAYSGVYVPIAPLLILSGEKDDWTPAAPCQELARIAQAAGHPVGIKVYPGALHSFDSDRPPRYDRMRSNINSEEGRGATTGGDTAAWADSIRQVRAFFAAHLPER